MEAINLICAWSNLIYHNLVIHRALYNLKFDYLVIPTPINGKI